MGVFEMKVLIERTKEEKELNFEGRVRELLSLLGVNQEAVLVSRGQELLTEEDFIGNNDVVKVLSVVSGG